MVRCRRTTEVGGREMNMWCGVTWCGLACPRETELMSGRIEWRWANALKGKVGAREVRYRETECKGKRGSSRGDFWTWTGARGRRWI